MFTINPHYLQVCNELQGAKLIRNDKRRVPGTFEPGLFERFLRAGHAAAIAPVGANGKVAYAAAMQAWGLTHRDIVPVMRWTLRFKELFKWREKNADVRGFFDAPGARADVPDPNGAGAAAQCAANAHDDHLAPAVGEPPRDDLATAAVAPTGSAAAHALPAAAVGPHAHAAGCSERLCSREPGPALGDDEGMFSHAATSASLGAGSDDRQIW